MANQYRLGMAEMERQLQQQREALAAEHAAAIARITAERDELHANQSDATV